MEAKGTGRAIAESLAEEVLQASTPAFEVFDQNTKGGIMVTPDSQLFELRHPYWANGSTLLPGRSTLLPYRKSGPDGGIEYTGPRCDPTYYSRGIEAEIATSDSSGRPYKISPNGIELVWPDGSTNSLEEFNFDPEALQYQFELASKVAYSDEEHRSNFITVAYQVERLLEQHGLTHAGLSLFPHAYNEKEWSNHPYVRLVKPWMRAFREFGIMSNQLTVGTGDPEAAMYALNEYQKYAAAISWATEAAPIRDSSFETTVGEHYGKQGEELSDPGKAAYLPAEVFEVLGEDTVFHDHREIARVAGSPSAGVYSSPAPQDLEVFLRSADHLLRGGHVVSSGRTLGWHTDRFREQARVEICNIATAGGNQERVLATHELVGRFIMAKMLEYDRMTPEDRLQRLANYALEAAHRIVGFAEGPDARAVEGDQTNAFAAEIVLGIEVREVRVDLGCRQRCRARSEPAHETLVPARDERRAVGDAPR